jgi:hypothetical protein
MTHEGIKYTHHLHKHIGILTLELVLLSLQIHSKEQIHCPHVQKLSPALNSEVQLCCWPTEKW